MESAKSYREKKAKPLVRKIVALLRSVYHAYIDISRKFEDVQKSCNQAWGKVNALSARVEELWEENNVLRDEIRDFELVKGTLGHDKVENIVRIERQREQALKEQKRAQRRKMDRGVR